MDNDSFEQSLRELLQNNPARQDGDALLERVLKRANRQVGAGALFTLLGRSLYALLLGLNRGSKHLQPVSRLKTPLKKIDRVD